MTRCLVCESTTLTPVTPRHLRCRACGLVFMPRWDENATERIYRSLVGSGQAAGIEQRRRTLFEAILARHPAPPGGRCLDVGCGTGEFLEVAAARGWRGVGVDPVAPALDTEQVRLVRAAFPPAPREMGGGPFDLAVFMDSLVYMRDPVDALAETRRLLRPGGTVVVRVTNAAFQLALRRVDRVVRALTRGRVGAILHPRSYTAAALARALARAGFVDVHVAAGPLTEGDPYATGAPGVALVKRLLRAAGRVPQRLAARASWWVPSLLAWARRPGEDAPGETCNLCGGRAWTTLEIAGPVRVVRCACGLVFVTPQPPRPALESAYDEAYYRAWEGQARARASIWRRRLDAVDRLAPGRGALLDVGAGDGTFLRLARARGWKVTGTELSPWAVAAARAAGLEIVQGELWEAGLAPGRFDVVTCWHVIEHQSDPRRMLVEIARVLRPGGWLVLTTPNLEGHVFRWAYLLARRRRLRLWEADEREVHLFHFTAATLSAMARAAGFEVRGTGFDRGAAAVPGKRAVNALAYAIWRLTGRNWGIGLELIAARPRAEAAS